MSIGKTNTEPATAFGHPGGLFALFFAEMWERFSYYGMRALLLFYMLKGFLGYGDSNAYAVYGAYTALVYMTPFFGGLLADKVIGARRAVILGGILMAAGHLLMTIENDLMFFTALGLLILGNGFFKPNISTIVGSLYKEGSPKRDAGFTIFYMGINLGAAMSPLLCGYVGETFGWHYGFGLATIGMLTGLAVFANWIPPNNAGSPPNPELLKQRPVIITQVLLGLSALVAAIGLFVLHPANIFNTTINVFVGVALIGAGAVGCYALRNDSGGFINLEWTVYLGAILFVPVFTLLVSGFAPFTSNGEPISIIPNTVVEEVEATGGEVAAVVLKEVAKPAGLILFLSGIVALAYLGIETFRLHRVARERMFVVLILTFFSMLFWAFFEQAGSSLNNFTDRNVDRTFAARVVTEDEVGSTITFRLAIETDDEELQQLPALTQEQLGHTYGNVGLTDLVADVIEKEERRKAMAAERPYDTKKEAEVNKLIVDVTRQQTDDGETSEKKRVLTMTALTYLRERLKNNPDDAPKTVDWEVTQSNVGMGIGGSEVPASVFQALNPIYILIFGIVFSALWTFLGKRGLEPNTPIKFALGLLQLGLGFGAIWYGAYLANDRGMVALFWLFLGYLLHTTGELCLSPVGLSMVTKLSPARLVSTVMGMWFLATAFSQFLAAIIAQFTGVGHGDGGGGGIPVPAETVDVYGGVFGKIAITAIISAAICLGLSPLLSRWMHEGESPPDDDPKQDRDGTPPGQPAPTIPPAHELTPEQKTGIQQP